MAKKKAKQFDAENEPRVVEVVELIDDLVADTDIPLAQLIECLEVIARKVAYDLGGLKDDLKRNPK